MWKITSFDIKMSNISLNRDHIKYYNNTITLGTKKYKTFFFGVTVKWLGDLYIRVLLLLLQMRTRVYDCFVVRLRFKYLSAGSSKINKNSSKNNKLNWYLQNIHNGSMLIIVMIYYGRLRSFLWFWKNFHLL